MTTEPDEERIAVLVRMLPTLGVEGGGRGGPHRAVGHNDVTRELLTFGRRIVPLLVARLPGSTFDEAVQLVFLLRELGATEARPAVRQLQTELAERSVGRDMTLRVQIDYFFRDT